MPCGILIPGRSNGFRQYFTCRLRAQFWLVNPLSWDRFLPLANGFTSHECRRCSPSLKVTRSSMSQSPEGVCARCKRRELCAWVTMRSRTRLRQCQDHSKCRWLWRDLTVDNRDDPFYPGCHARGTIAQVNGGVNQPMWLSTQAICCELDPPVHHALGLLTALLVFGPPSMYHTSAAWAKHRKGPALPGLDDLSC